MVQLTEMPVDRPFVAIYQRNMELYSDKLKWFRDKLYVLSTLDGDNEYIETKEEYARQFYADKRAIFLIAD